MPTNRGRGTGSTPNGVPVRQLVDGFWPVDMPDELLVWPDCGQEECTECEGDRERQRHSRETWLAAHGYAGWNSYSTDIPVQEGVRRSERRCPICGEVHGFAAEHIGVNRRCTYCGNQHTVTDWCEGCNRCRPEARPGELPSLPTCCQCRQCGTCHRWVARPGRGSSGVSSTCDICSQCTECCTCVNASINELRRRISRNRFQREREQSRAQARQERQQMEGVLRGDGIIFIPAGTGKEMTVVTGARISPLELAERYGLRDLPLLKEANPHVDGSTWLKRAPGSMPIVLPKTAYQFKENPLERYLVPEIEVSGAGRSNMDALDNLLISWGGGRAHDGSLPSSGFEINLSPSQGDMYTTIIRSVCDKLATMKAFTTEACGLHVHVDTRDFLYPDLRRIILLYELVEPGLFSMLPTVRLKSRFCIPCGKTYADSVRANKPFTVGRDGKRKHDKGAIIKSVYGTNADRPSARSKYGDGAEAHATRYRALNLYSWFFRRTLEFRHYPGTINAEEIISWTLLCTWLVDYAYRTAESKILALGPVPRNDKVSHSQNVLLQVAALAPGGLGIRFTRYIEQCVEWYKPRKEGAGEGTGESLGETLGESASRAPTTSPVTLQDVQPMIDRLNQLAPTPPTPQDAFRLRRRSRSSTDQ